jgi:peptide/nickel transport system substrate-binding protein
MKRRRFLAAATAATALPRFAIAQPAASRVLRFVPQANLTLLDPIATTAAVSSNHGYMIFDTLFGLNGRLEPKPQMAEGFTVSDDGRTYLIRLRDGLKFHDGEPVRAQDCAPSLARWAARDTFGQTVATFVDEWGVADDKTVKITLKQKFPLLIEAIAKADAAIAFIMPERLAKTDPYKIITEMVGSGPFKFVKDEFVSGSSVVYARNADYVPRQEKPDWTAGGKVVNFDRVEWKIIPDPSTAASALQAGEVDWYEQVQADLVPLLRRDKDLVLGPSNPQGYIAGMRFNHLHPPFNDVRLRRAMLVAVNQDDYMRAVTGNDPSLFQICRSQYPCGTTYGAQMGGDAMSGNIAKAKEMIKEAGYNGAKAVLINPTDFATIAPLGDLTYDLLQKLAINTELVDADWGTVVQRRASKEPVDKGGWSIFHTWFTGGFILNPVVSAPFRGQGAKGWFGWYDNPKVEQLTHDWLMAPDLASRKKIAQEIQVENFSQVPTITLGQFQIPTAYRKNLTDKVACSSPLFWGLKRA